MTNPGESSSQIPICNEPINFSKEVPVGSSHFMEDPDIKAAEEEIWKSQVIISCPNSPHAFLGPFPDDSEDQEKLSVVFPSSKKHLPLVFTKGPYDLSVLKSKFRTEPKHENYEEYISWLDKVEKKKGQFWKDIGIFDLVQLSKQGPKYHNEMLIAALHFWNPSTSSLHLKCGMLTPTLLDVVGLTGLKPTSYTFDPTDHGSKISFDFTRLAYGNFIMDHRVITNDKVSDKEHIAFLTYWLSM